MYLSLHNVINEGPIFFLFFCGLVLFLIRRGLIVVKETDKALVRWLLQYILTHASKERIFRLILTRVGLRTLGCVCV